MTDICAVVITASDAAWLTAFGRRLVEDRLCASVQQGQRVESTRWVGDEVRSRIESSITLHTRASLVQEISDRVTDEQVDGLPCLVVLPVTAAAPEYGTWVAAETARG
jgi:uncharacterized protein involved in tolerance to divalent cations